MKIKFFIPVIFIIPIFCCGQKIKNPDLRTELLNRLESDQKLRREMPDEPEKITTEMIKKMIDSDRKNTEWLMKIVSRYGFPGKSKVCEDGTYAAFIIVQHSSWESGFQKRVLPMLKKAVKKGEVSGIYLAYLTDRILINENKPQLYGSQLRFENGKLIPFPIKDEATVDQRRLRLGLPTMEDYVQGQKSVLVQPECSALESKKVK